MKRKFYMIEYIDWSTGYVSGYSYRVRIISEDKSSMLNKLKVITEKKNIYNGYEPPVWFELEGEEKDIDTVLAEYEENERTKNMGAGI